MKIKRFYLFWLLCLLVSSIRASDKSVLANSPEITFTGRVQRLEDGGVKYDWIGVYLQAEFTGGRIAVLLFDEGTSYHNVFIDGKWLRKIKISGTVPQKIVLADRLTRGSHLLCLQKCTEGEFGCTTIKELIIDKTAKLKKVVPKERFIEFIGDSYTCGYGVESNRAEDPFLLETENCNKAYACLVARYFKADYALIAHSGQGMVRHWGDSVQMSTHNMPERWTHVFDEYGMETYDYQAYVPNLVVINLGTNDFSPTAIPFVEQYVGTYIKLIESIKLRYGDIPVLCITPHSANVYLKAALNELRDKMLYTNNVYMANCLERIVSDKCDLGASSHPNYQGQYKIAMSLIPQISTIMDWQLDIKL